MTIRTAVHVAMVAATGVTLSAHHAVRSVFDSANLVPLAGVISSVQIVNPHVTVRLEATGPDGRVTAWAVEMAPPGVLKRLAFDFQLLNAGRQVVIESWLRKDGQAGQANGRTLVMPDGRRFEIGDNWDRSMTLPVK